MNYEDLPGGQVVKTSPSHAGDMGLITQGAKIPQTSQLKKNNIKHKQYCKKFNKDFKSGLYQVS